MIKQLLEGAFTVFAILFGMAAGWRWMWGFMEAGEPDVATNPQIAYLNATLIWLALIVVTLGAIRFWRAKW